MANLSKDEIQQLVATGFADPVFFCKTFLRHVFTKEIPWFHRAIFSIITGQTDFLLKYGEMDKILSHFVWRVDPSDPESDEVPMFSIIKDDAGKEIGVNLNRGKFTEIIMPRGFAKTTVVGYACIIWKIVYKEEKFVVYISETARSAEQQMNNVKTELNSNLLIQKCFGSLVPSRMEDKKNRADILQLRNGTVLAARGRIAQIRGLNVDTQRPTCILFDDVEDLESVSTETQRLKVREWFFADVLPAIAELDDSSTIIGLGTLLHREALLPTLALDPDWTTITLGAIDRDGAALWAANQSLKHLERKKQRYMRAGMLAQYYMEYESQIRNDESAPFKEHMILHKPELIGADFDAVALALDPAISDAVKADGTAIAVVGILPTGLMVVLECLYKVGMTPREQINKFFELSKMYNVTLHGVESNAYQRSLIYNIKEEMFRKNQYLGEVRALHHKTAKNERILGILQPRYSSGYIVHARRFVELETQLLDFPNNKKDAPDALAMAISLLDPYAANSANPTIDLEEDEYEPLTNWRQY